MSADAAICGAEDTLAAAGEPPAPRTPSPGRANRPSAASPLSGASTPGKASGSAASQQSDLLASIERLKKEQKDLKAEKKRVAAELRNAEKRRKRLRQRARQLSDADLVQVLQMRQAASSSTDKPQEGAEVSEERESQMRVALAV